MGCFYLLDALDTRNNAGGMNDCCSFHKINELSTELESSYIIMVNGVVSDAIQVACTISTGDTLAQCRHRQCYKDQIIAEGDRGLNSWIQQLGVQQCHATAHVVINSRFRSNMFKRSINTIFCV